MAESGSFSYFTRSDVAWLRDDVQQVAWVEPLYLESLISSMCAQPLITCPAMETYFRNLGSQ